MIRLNLKKIMSKKICVFGDSISQGYNDYNEGGWINRLRKYFDLLNDEDLNDGLHPNADGHEKMFNRVKDFLIENKII